MASEEPPWLEDLVKYSLAAFLIVFLVLLAATVLAAI